MPATITFDGGVSGLGTTLNTATNWSGEALPDTSSEALLDNSVITLPAALTTSAAVTYGDLLINSSTLGSLSLTGATSFSTTLSGGGGGAAAIAAGGAAGDLLLLGTNVTGSVTIGGGSGTGKLNLALGADGNFNVVNASATANVTGILSGAFNLTKSGLGTLTLSGANTWGAAKTFTLNSGTVNVNSATALGDATNVFQINGGTVDNTTGAAISLSNANPIAFNGDFSFTGGTGTTHNLAFPGAVTLGGAGTTRTITANAGTLTLSGNFANGVTADSIAKAGNGQVTLSGTNGYTGTTLVSAGTLDFLTLAALYGGVTTSWVSANIDVKAGATFAVGYGNVGQFAAADVDLLRTNLSTATPNQGFEAGARLGFDTSGAATSSTYSSSITNTAAGALGVTKLGANTLVLSGSNSYTGVTTVIGGTLSVGAMGNGGTNGGIGAASNAASNIVIMGGAGLIASGTTDRLFSIGGGGTVSINNVASQPIVTYTNTGAIGFVDVNSTHTFQFGSTNSSVNFAPLITDNGAGKTSVSIGSGANGGGSAFAGLTLANPNNSYTGTTTSGNGNGSFYTVTKLANGGQNSSIGASSNAASNWTFGATGGNTANLYYVGSGDSTNRNYTMSGGSLGWISSGAGPLVMSGAATYAGTAAARTITFAGTNANNNTYGGVLANGSGANVLSVAKSNAGTWVLTADNTYTGTTAVNAGILQVGDATHSPTSMPTTALTVASNAQFSYLPQTPSTLTLGAASTLTLNANSTVNMAFGSTITALGAATIGSNVVINLTGSFVSGTTYTLLNAASGLDTANFVFSPTNFSYTITATPTSLKITPTAVAALTNAYWLGGVNSGNWTTSDGATPTNWTSDGAGTSSLLIPGPTANVIFSDVNALAANQTGMTLGSNLTINSLTVNSANPVGLSAGTFALTLGGSNGITLNPGAGAVTLSPSVVLGVNQTWTNNASNSLTVGGIVSGVGKSLATEGAGTIVLSGVNTFDGGLTIKSGTTSGTVVGSFGGSVGITLGDSAGNSNATLSGGGAVTFTNPITVASGNTGVAVISSSANATFSGAVTLSNHGLSLIPAASTLTLSGGITGTGNLTLGATGAGTITVSTNAVNHTGTITNNGSGAGAATISSNIGPNVGLISQSSSTSSLTLSGVNTFTNGVALTLGALRLGSATALGATASALTISSGTSLDSTVANLVIANNNPQTWNGSFTFTGTQNLNVGTGTITLPAPITLTTSSKVLTVGGTIAGGNGIFDITKAGSGTLTYLPNIALPGNRTVNATAGTEILSGVVSGTGFGLTMAGAGTLSLTNTNTYSGPTAVAGGTLTLSGTAASSAATVSAGAVLNFDSSATGATGATRVSSVTLRGGSLTVSGNVNGTGNVNSVDTISGPLTIDANSATSGVNIVTLSGGTATNWQLAASSLARANNGVVLFRGTSLGANTLVSATPNTSNIGLTTAPTGANFVGGGGGAGTQNISIIPWAVGDTSAAGGGSSFVTYDANGIRPLAAGEYDNTITGGTVSDHNVSLAIPTTTTTTVNGDTTVNSLFLTTSGTGTAGILAGTGKLTVASGAVYGNYGTAGLTISKQIDFGSIPGVVGSNNGSSGFNALKLTGGISGSAGVTFYTTPTVPGADSGIALEVSTYTGDTTVLGNFQVVANGALPNGTRTGDVYVYGRLEIQVPGSSVTINGLNGTGTVSHVHSTGNTLNIGDNNANGSFSGTITAPGQMTINKIGAGTQVLSGTSSTYINPTNIRNGILSIASIGNVSGGNSSIGNPSSVGNGTIAIGQTTTTGQLTYTGTGNVTDRVINLLGTTGGATLDQSGTGLLKFTSPFTATGAGSKNLTLQGSTAGTGELAGAIVDNSGANKTSVVKSGSGAWTLSGPNTYTGNTTITGGTLFVNNTTGSGTGTGSVAVNVGTLGGSGTISGPVTVIVGGNLAPGNSIGTLTITNTLNLGGIESFEVTGGSGPLGSADKVAGITALTYGGTLKIFNVGAAVAAGDSWDLFDFTSQSAQFDNNAVFGTSGDGTNLPTLTGGLLWQFDYTTGILSVAQGLLAPTVTSMAPVVGPTTGGTMVVITGMNFVSISSVTIAGTPLATFSVSGTTQISITTPAHAAGAVDVVVTNAAGSGSLAGTGDFTYSTPTVASVVVNGGPGVVLGGSTWSLAGQNSVVKQIVVTFNKAVTVASDAFTVTSVPVNPSGGPGVVVVNGGAAPSSAAVTASIAATLSPSSYLITFSGPGTHAGGVINSGVYDLTTLAGKVTADGESMTGNNVSTFFAMFGTINANDSLTTGTIGDGLSNAFVDPGSLFQFSDAFGSSAATPVGPPAYNIVFDSNLDGFIDPGDLFAFSDSFGIDWDF